MTADETEQQRGTDADFWRDRAAAVRASGPPGDPDVERELRWLAEAQRYERLYSAAAQLLAIQGYRVPDDWPEPRRRYWRELAAVLATGRPDRPGTAADPAWQLASRADASGRPITIADAVRDWYDRVPSRWRKLDYTKLDEVDLDERDLDDVHAPRREHPVVALPGLTRLIVNQLLEELTLRMTPGRPAGAVGDAGADLAAVVRGLADQLRTALGDTALGDTALGETALGDTARPAHPPAPRGPQALAAGLDLPAALEELTAAAHRAASSVPSPQQLVEAADYSVRHAAAVAAANLLEGLRAPAGPGWREQHEGVRPDLHMLTELRLGRPVGLAEGAARIQAALRDLPPPWRPGPGRPVPESTPRSGFYLLPDAAALVTAELLDELAARLRPGQWVGTIRISAWPLQHFVYPRLHDQAIAV